MNEMFSGHVTSCVVEYMYSNWLHCYDNVVSWTSGIQLTCASDGNIYLSLSLSLSHILISVFLCMAWISIQSASKYIDEQIMCMYTEHHTVEHVRHIQEPLDPLWHEWLPWKLQELGYTEHVLHECERNSKWSLCYICTKLPFFELYMDIFPTKLKHIEWWGPLSTPWLI